MPPENSISVEKGYCPSSLVNIHIASDSDLAIPRHLTVPFFE
jgi:hypothetical protein